MTLRDQHLQQALRNAPDRELTPGDAIRSAVLTYANQVLKPHHRGWQSRLTDLLHALRVSNWQIASMGSVLATLLVVVVFWHERPDDTIWVTELTKATIAENSKGAADAVSSKQFSANKPAEAVTEEKSLAPKSLGKLSQDKALAKDVQAGNPRAALPAAPAESTAVASADAVARNEGQLSKKSEAPSVATVATAEADKFATASAPETIAASGGDSTSSDSVNSAANAASVAKADTPKDDLAESKADLKARGQETAAKEPMIAAKVQDGAKSKADPAKVGVKIPAKINAYDVNAALAEAIKIEGGRAIASKDIQAGNLRLLKLEEQSVKGVDSVKCPQPATQSLNIDALTGYKIVMINVCSTSEALLKEVDEYNQTMREWHAKDGQSK